MNDSNESHSILYGVLVTQPNAPSCESADFAAGSGRRFNKVALTVLGATLLSLLTLL